MSKKSSWTVPDSIVAYYEKYENKEKLVETDTFMLPECFSIVDTVGRGAYGVVVAAKNKQSDEMVAIKKIQKAFDHKIFAKRTLRELKIMRLLNHENILKLKKILLPKSRAAFEDIYLVSELVEGDLYSIIKNRNSLEPDHVKFILYQILRALKYQHSARILHRDLKPRNLLVSKECVVKVCDFGLARIMNDSAKKKTEIMTDYVATRWYRAPELLLGNESYDEKIDVWSVGCIFAEMLLRKPFLMGTDWKDQLMLILKFLGKDRTQDISFIENANAKSFIQTGSKNDGDGFKQFEATGVGKEGIHLLQEMLVFSPKSRISVEDALKHPFLADFHDPEDEPTCAPVNPLEFEFEHVNLNKEQLKDLIYEEILLYHFKALEDQHKKTLADGGSTIAHITGNANKDYDQFEKEDDKNIEAEAK